MFSLRKNYQKRSAAPSPPAVSPLASPHASDAIRAFRPEWVPTRDADSHQDSRSQDVTDQRSTDWHCSEEERASETTVQAHSDARYGEERSARLPVADRLARATVENAELQQQRDKAVSELQVLQQRLSSVEAALKASVQRATTFQAQLQDARRKHAVAAAEQLAALEGAAEEVQLAHVSEQLALKLALTPIQENGSSPEAEAPQPSADSQPQDVKGAVQSACDLLQKAAHEIHRLADRCAAAEASLVAAEAQHKVQQTVLQAAGVAAVLSQRTDSAAHTISALRSARRPRKTATTATTAAVEEAERVMAALRDAAAVATAVLASLAISEDGEGDNTAALVAAAGAELHATLDIAHAAGAALSEALKAAEQRLTRAKSPTRRPRHRKDPAAGGYAAIEQDLAVSSDDSYEEEPVGVALETGSSSDIMTPLRTQQRRGQSKGRAHGWLARVLHSDLHAAQQSPRRAKAK